MQEWKPEVVVEVLRAAYPHLRWEEVAASLDYEGFYVPDDSANKLLLSAWQFASGKAFPLDVLCGHLWTNTMGQLSFLKYAVGVPPHLVRWDQAPRKMVRLHMPFCTQAHPSDRYCHACLVRVHIPRYISGPFWCVRHH